MDKLNLMDLSLKETEELITSMGEPRFRGRQIFKWVHQKGILRFAEMTDQPAKLREKLESACYLGNLEVSAKQNSADGTTKYLFKVYDTNSVESVLLPHDYGISVCVSSQVGCRMGCRFCASTIGGLVRNLSAGEIYSQVISIQKDSGKRVGSIVVMGSGEPFDNYDEVIKFIRLIISPDALNIGARHITVSTCGDVPGIKRFAGEGLQVTLSISLHAPNDELRDQIMPVNRKYPIASLINACRDYISITNRRITFEYALINDFNDSYEQALELGRLLKGLLCHVNLIPLNQVDEREYRQSNLSKVRAFHNTLEKVGVPVTIRKRMGADIDAACGQLRRRAAQGEITPGRG
ncbi:MAG TPA: 23S rRNA (adenine(2503)-C(2))-methyltransferase RlmN [Desulfobacteria bacterium]|nr:23S rRNA (adenine(2503)-C(2))-methyltransferase RlmN [Desulfobacteria bacterium]